jgi:hypothetical protein
MTYYKLHTNMVAQPEVYHGNICVQHCVRGVVDSQFPGKKSQRLYIRIYCDIKIIVLYLDVQGKIIPVVKKMLINV